jgi:obg-like ATPase 1
LETLLYVRRLRAPSPCFALTDRRLKNFPYATIDPEEARVIVPDERYDWLCEKYNPKSRVPANLTVYDIAGLTRGASTGAGLGNSFLSHIRAVDAIFQVVRCFDDAEIIHVEGDVNPVRDLDIIAEELRLKDIEFIEKILQWLKDGKDVRKGHWAPKEVRPHLVSYVLLFPTRTPLLLL